MDRMPLVAVAFISVPEEIMLTTLGLALLGLRPKWYLLVLVGVLEAISSFLIRMLPLVVGVHTLVQALVFAAIITLVLRYPYRVSITAILLSGTLYIALEGTVLPTVQRWTGIPAEEIMAHGWLRVAFFIPQGLILLAITAIVLLSNFKLIDYRRSVAGAREKLEPENGRGKHEGS